MMVSSWESYIASRLYGGRQRNQKDVMMMTSERKRDIGLGSDGDAILRWQRATRRDIAADVPPTLVDISSPCVTAPMATANRQAVAPQDLSHRDGSDCVTRALDKTARRGSTRRHQPNRSIKSPTVRFDSLPVTSARRCD